jgi:hypothetical protein
VGSRSKRPWWPTKQSQIIEVAGLCHSKSGQGLFGELRRRPGCSPQILWPLCIASNHGMKRDPRTCELARSWGAITKRRARIEEMILPRSGFLSETPATFDYLLLFPSDLTYEVPIGHSPTQNHQIWALYPGLAYITQMAGYLVWPDRQSLIVGQIVSYKQTLQQKKVLVPAHCCSLSIPLDPWSVPDLII